MTKKRYTPYFVNKLPTQVMANTCDWRRQNAKSVETETIKPESFLPVTTGATGRSPICFNIKSVPQSRVDGNNIFVEVSFKIERYSKSTSQWVPTTIDSPVCPIANTCCSLFEDLNVTINGVLAESTQRDFAIKAYLQNLLFSSPSDRETWMGSGMLALHSRNKFMSIIKNPDGGTIQEYTRALTSDGSKVHTIRAKLLSDVLCCSEPMPDTVNIGIKLFPAKSEACLIQTRSTGVQLEEYRVSIVDCTLYVPRIQAINGVSNYSFTNWKTLAYTHQAGQTNFKKDIAIGETLPQKAMVVFLPEKAYNGSWDTNKIDFRPVNVSSVLMKCNQRHVPLMNGYKCDWVNKSYHGPFVGLTTELGAVGHPITYSNYDDGYCIFPFDLTPNKTGNIALEHALRGALELDVEFKNAPTENMMVVVLLIYADSFEISKSGTYSQT